MIGRTRCATLAVAVAGVLSWPDIATAEETPEETAAADGGWETAHPGLVWTGAIFSGVSLINFGVVGGYSGEEPDALFHVALVSGAAHWLVGVTLLSTGLILDESNASAAPRVGVSPSGASLGWRF